MPKTGFFSLAVVAFVLSACGGVPDQRVIVPKAQIDATQRINYRTVVLREVSLPTYAASEDIYVADENGHLRTTAGRLWADDPSRAVTLELSRYLQQITNAKIAPAPWPFTGYPDAEIEIRIEDMLAHPDNSFKLSGQYFVAAENGRERGKLFDLTVPIPGNIDATSIAEARAQAVRDLAFAIARDGLR